MSDHGKWERAFGVWTLLYFSGAVGACLAHPDMWPRAAQAVDIALGIPTCLLVAWLSARRLGARSAIALRHWSMLALLCLAILSPAWSVAPWPSALAALRLTAATAFALYVGHRFPLEDVLRIALAALATMLLLSYLLTLGSPSLGMMPLPGRPSAWRGVFLDKNALGFVAALTVTSGALGLCDARLRRWSALPFVLALPALLLCRSAGALLAVACSLLGVLVVASFRRFRSTGGRVVWTAAILALVLAVTSSTGSRVLIRLFNRDMTLTTRAEIWVTVLPWIAERPWVGHGYHAFWEIAQRPIHERLKLTPDEVLPEGYPGHAHNGVLETAADLGAMGVLLLGAMVLVATSRALGRAKDTAPSYWPLAVVGAVLAHNLVETSFLQTRGAGGVGWILFLVAAVAPAAERAPASAGDQCPARHHL
jgi:O-antigen ligase